VTRHTKWIDLVPIFRISINEAGLEDDILSMQRGRRANQIVVKGINETKVNDVVLGTNE